MKVLVCCSSGTGSSWPWKRGGQTQDSYSNTQGARRERAVAEKAMLSCSVAPLLFACTYISKQVISTCIKYTAPSKTSPRGLNGGMNGPGPWEILISLLCMTTGQPLHFSAPQIPFCKTGGQAMPLPLCFLYGLFRSVTFGGGSSLHPYLQHLAQEGTDFK